MSSPQLHEIKNLEALIQKYEHARNAWGRTVRTAANAQMRMHQTALRIARNLGRGNNAFNNVTGLPNAEIASHHNYQRNLATWRNARQRQNRDVGGHRASMLTTQRRLNRTFGPGNLQAHITRWRQVIKPFVQSFVCSYPQLTNKEVGFILTRNALSHL